MDQQQTITFKQTVVWLSLMIAILSLLRTLFLRQGGKTTFSNEETQRQMQETSARKCNGLENLCDIPANEIMYASLHNGNHAKQNGALILPNHFYELESALQAGYRGLNMDIGRCNGELTLFHNYCFTDTRDLNGVLRDIVKFLNENPNEVIIMPTEVKDNGITVTEIDQEFALVEGWHDLMYDHTAGKAWPTLGQLIEANTRILFFFYNDAKTSCFDIPCPPGIHSWFDYAVENPFRYQIPLLLWITTNACRFDRGIDGLKDFFAINAFTLPSCFIFSFIINKGWFIKDLVQRCTNYNNGYMPNLVFVNFWHIGGVLKVVNEFNAEL